MPLPMSKKPYFLPSSETRIFLIVSFVLFVTLNLYSSAAKADANDSAVNANAMSRTLADNFFMVDSLLSLDLPPLRGPSGRTAARILRATVQPDNQINSLARVHR